MLQVIAEAGPYPMIIEPPDKGWVIHVDEDIDGACDEDGVWTAPEISTEHFVLDSDTTAFAYGRHFVGKVGTICIIIYQGSVLYAKQHSY